MLAFAGSSRAQGVIDAYAEEFIPYNYRDKGRPTGYAVDLLQAVCAEAGLTCRIDIAPWARAYHEAATKPNTLVFSTARTAERESAFIWLGPITARRVYFYVRADSPLHITRIEDLQGLKIGAVNDDVVIGQLERRGVKPEQIELAPNGELNIRKLLAGRADVAPFVDVGIAMTLRSMGLDPALLRQEMLFADAGDLYYALNPGTDPGTAEALKRAWAKLAVSAQRDAIAARYALTQ